MGCALLAQVFPVLGIGFKSAGTSPDKTGWRASSPAETVDSEFPVSIRAGVSVGHNAVLHGCTVEDNALIGMDVVILNAAVIGAGAPGRQRPRACP
jgi:UDP-3-O-[3-hydroxymyristoyl] glucosamine N-acyltransferase